MHNCIMSIAFERNYVMLIQYTNCEFHEDVKGHISRQNNKKIYSKTKMCIIKFFFSYSVLQNILTGNSLDFYFENHVTFENRM